MSRFGNYFYGYANLSRYFFLVRSCFTGLFVFFLEGLCVCGGGGGEQFKNVDFYGVSFI